MSKKSYIIDKAKRYFNQQGYQSVTLHELAQHLEMSRGNLTYHFKDKSSLLQAIADEMWDKMKIERSKSRKLPSFENLHNEVQLYYKFQREYSFIFLDTQVLNDPVIKEAFREMTEQTIEDNKANIAFSIQIGNMRAESYPGMYNNIAMITWMLSFFWLPQQVIRGERSREDGERLIWSILIPHFTEKGIKSFTKFYGEEMLQSLGEPFEMDLSSIVSF